MSALGEPPVPLIETAAEEGWGMRKASDRKDRDQNENGEGKETRRRGQKEEDFTPENPRRDGGTAGRYHRRRRRHDWET